VASQVISVKGPNIRPKLECMGTSDWLSVEGEIKIAKTRLRDASLAYKTNIETLQMLNRPLID
jgi:hypothetical protein